MADALGAARAEVRGASASIVSLYYAVPLAVALYVVPLTVIVQVGKYFERKRTR